MVSSAVRVIRLAHPQVALEDLLAGRELFETGILTKGPVLARFEAACAQRLGVRHAVATSSGTTALHLALLALGIGAGDEVVTPDFSFPASANAVVHAGGTPVLADVDLDYYNMDPADLARRITPRTRAVMVVHQFGCPAPMDAVADLARNHGLPVIEDAACAFGATWREQACGTLGNVGCFSFHPRKVLTTAEGGLVVTDDASIAAPCRMLRDHGIAETPEGRAFVEVGYNFRLSELHAAVGLAQLERVDGWIKRRRELAARYHELLRGLGRLHLPGEPAGGCHIYQSYVVRVEEGIQRDRVIGRLKEDRVESVPGNWAIHAQPYYRTRYGHNAGDLRRSWLASRQTLALPLHPALSDDDVTYVAECLESAIRG